MLQQTNRSAFLNGYTNWRMAETSKFVMSRGEGVYVYGADGTKYLEGLAGLWCTSLGFSERRLAEAAADQMRTLPYYHTFYGRATEVGLQLAEKLAEMTPGNLNRVYFTCSGSEANDTAIKLITYYNNALGRPAKKKFIVRKQAYHGVTLASGSATQLPILHQDFDPLSRFLVTHAPHYFANRLSEHETEEEFTDRILADLEALILREGAETIAAFMAEPIQGAGGVVIPPRCYFSKLHAMLKKHDILLLADEVITGFGRTGSAFGSAEYGFQPDLMCVAKALSSGYQPIGAVILGEHIYDVIADRTVKNFVLGHGFTYGGHPVPCAVALATLQIYESDGIFERAQQQSPKFIAGLQEIAQDSGVVELRAQGMIAALELNTNGLPDGLIALIFAEKALALGLIVRPAGNAVALCPPLIITDDEITELHEKLQAALAATKAEVGL